MTPPTYIKLSYIALAVFIISSDCTVEIIGRNWKKSDYCIECDNLIAVITTWSKNKFRLINNLVASNMAANSSFNRQTSADFDFLLELKANKPYLTVSTFLVIIYVNGLKISLTGLININERRR